MYRSEEAVQKEIAAGNMKYLVVCGFNEGIFRANFNLKEGRLDAPCDSCFRGDCEWNMNPEIHPWAVVGGVVFTPTQFEPPAKTAMQIAMEKAGII